MKREVCLVLILLLTLILSSFQVIAAEELDDSDIDTEDFELTRNVPLKVNGKTIELKDDGINEAYIEVDGQHGVIVYDDFTYIYGVSIRLLSMSEANQYNDLIAHVNITSYGSCGDGICHEREYCCKDCGCKEGQDCVDNQCILAGLNECVTDSECLDEKRCTIDTCEGVPRSCKHTLIKICKSGDGCCAVGCTVDNDRDCASIDIECITHEDCNEGEKCSGITHICYKIESKINEEETESEEEIIINENFEELEETAVGIGLENIEEEKIIFVSDYKALIIISIEIIIFVFILFGWDKVFK